MTSKKGSLINPTSLPPDEHGNEAHDPDFEEEGVAAGLVDAHKDLDTGVHGAGDDTLATDADIATHAGDDDAHHAKYTDGEADARVAAGIATHAAIAAAHHALVTIGADNAHSLEGQVLSAVLAAAAQVGHVGTAAQTFGGAKTFADGILTDTINEKTATHGILVDLLTLIKDGKVYPDYTNYPACYVYSDATGTGLIFDTGDWFSYSKAANLFGIIIASAPKFTVGAAAADFYVPLDMNSNPITAVSDPSAAQDAATKAYVDLHILKSLLTTRGDMIRRGASAPERFAKGTSGKFLKAGANDPDWQWDEAVIPYIIDGGGSEISTGYAGGLDVPFDCFVTGWTITAQDGNSGSIVVDVWKDTYAQFPPTVEDTIAGSEKPTISASNKGQNLTLGTWTQALTKGDWLAFNVDSVTTLTRITVSLRVDKYRAS